MKSIARFVSAVLLLCTVVLCPAAVWGKTGGYDVSYLWSGRLDGVVAYRQKVKSVLGPEIARELRIAKNSRLYGLLFPRNGSSNGAYRIARSHTKLLRKYGLEDAAPIRARKWKFVDDTGLVTDSEGSVVMKPEWNIGDEGLEAAVKGYMERLRSEAKLTPDERTAWSVYDFTTGEKLVSLNENVQFQAASLVKPFFALVFFDRVRRGELVYGRKSRRHMRRMIQYSNNSSTNWVMRQLGGPQAIDRVLRRNYPRIFQDTRIVEYIPANGRTYLNKATASDYSRFLLALWNDEIPGADEIKRLMALPGSDRIYTGTDAIPTDTVVYNKTGSTAQLCGDMGILVVRDKQGRRFPYTLVGVIEKRRRAKHYSSWIRSRSNVIRDVSSLVYQGISRHHNLSRYKLVAAGI